MHIPCPCVRQCCPYPQAHHTARFIMTRGHPARCLPGIGIDVTGFAKPPVPVLSVHNTRPDLHRPWRPVTGIRHFCQCWSADQCRTEPATRCRSTVCVKRQHCRSTKTNRLHNMSTQHSTNPPWIQQSHLRSFTHTKTAVRLTCLTCHYAMTRPITRIYIAVPLCCLHSGPEGGEGRCYTGHPVTHVAHAFHHCRLPSPRSNPA